MSDTYAIADPHLDREGKNVINRPFGSTLEMSREIVGQINSRVKRQDRLIIDGYRKGRKTKVSSPFEE